MDLRKATSSNLIDLNSEIRTKEEAIRFMAKKLFEHGKIRSVTDFLEDVYEREAMSPTGFQDGLAVPHGKSDTVIEASFAVLRLQEPLEQYESIDSNNQVKLLFLLAIPTDEAGSTHLAILSQLMTKLSDENYLAQLMTVKEPEAFYHMLEAKEEKPKASLESADLILAITACPAGIAHTYMAAEALVKAGEKLGVRVLVEKQGSNGIEGRHGKAQIQKAKAVIFANDVAIKEADRFDGLPKINTSVAAPLKDAESIILKALGKASNYKPSEATSFQPEEEADEKESVGKVVKDSVLTGISYIIPIIIAGGMISAIATMIIQIFDLQTLAADPTSWIAMLKSLGGGMLGILMVPVLAAFMSYSIADKPGLAPGFAGGLAANMINSGFLGGMLAGLLAGFLMKYMKENIKAKGAFSGFVSFWLYPVVGSFIVGFLMLFVVGRPITFINTSLIDWLDSLQGSSAILLGAVIGIMVSFDLGGPVNKAAYAFCIGAMASGNYLPYATFASVKMVSAFSLSAACLLAKDIFTDQEREIGTQTWILGLAGITEGAIPVAMNDPIRVLGSFILGSMVTGGIVAYAGIGLTVPGAGIFSMGFLVGINGGLANAMIWFGAALLGAAISTFFLIVTRKQKLAKQVRHA